MRSLYQYQSSTCVYSYSLIFSPYSAFILNDAPPFISTTTVSKEYLSQYICDTTTVLKQRLDECTTMGTSLDSKAELHLRTLLENLIEAKRIWHEEYALDSERI